MSRPTEMTVRLIGGPGAGKTFRTHRQANEVMYPTQTEVLDAYDAPALSEPSLRWDKYRIAQYNLGPTESHGCYYFGVHESMSVDAVISQLWDAYAEVHK